MASTAPGTCIAGLQGFPIQISGLNSLTQEALSQLYLPNDIELQFSPSQSPIQLSEATGYLAYHGQNTFFLSGTQYNLVAMRLCAPKQEGLTTFSGPVLAELQFWGLPSTMSIANTQLAALVIPITQSAAPSFSGNAFYSMLLGNAVQLADLFPSGRIVKYVTCTETNTPSNLNIAVAYWSNGILLNSEMTKRLPILRANGIPATLSSNKVLTVFEQSADGSKFNRRYEEKEGVKLTYTKGFIATAPEVLKGFRIIATSNVSKQTISDSEGQQSLKNYKCITIDKNRDIKDGKLILNPLTGRPFEEELDEQKAAESAQLGLDVKPATIGSNSIWITVCIVIGVLIGIGILAALAVVATKVLMNPEAVEITRHATAAVPGAP